MAMGYLPFGIVPFAAVKFLGYSAAAFVIQRAYRAAPPSVDMLRKDQATPRSPWFVGGIRTLIGIAAGLAYAKAWEAASGNPSLTSWWLNLVPVRLLEWYLVIWWFFDRHHPQPGRLVFWVIVGALWSYVLDVPALWAVWVTPGAVWVC